MGYLTRVSDENGYDGPYRIFQIVSCDPLLPLRQAGYGPLAGLTDVLGQEILTRCYWPERGGSGNHRFCRTEVKRSMLNLSRPRVCPLCLKEHQARLIEWDLASVACCPHHQTILIDQCPTCSSPLSWKHASVSRCGVCDADLSKSPMREADPGAVSLTSLMLSKAGMVVPSSQIDGPVEVPLNEMNLISVIQAVLFLGSHANGRGIGVGNWLCARLTAAAMHRVVASAASILFGWPGSYFEFLAKVREAWSGRTGLVYEFGSFYETLTKSLPGPQFDFLRNEFERFLTESWDGGFLSQKNRKLNVQASEVFIPKARAAEILHVRPKTIDQLHRTGSLEGVRRQMGGRHLVLIRTDSVRKYQYHQQSLMTAQETSTALGLSEKPLKDLVQEGLLLPSPTAPANRSRPYVFDQKDVEALLDLVFSGVVKCKPDQGYLSYSVAMRKLTAVGWTVSRLIKEIRDRGILVRGRDMCRVGVQQCVFGPADIERVIKMHAIAPQGLYTLPEVAEKLGLKQQVVYALVKSGKLPSSKEKRRGRSVTLVSDADVARFNRTYISAAKIAASHHTSSRYAIQMLRNKNVGPVTGPDIDGNRQVFFRRSDVPVAFSVRAR
ncbi:helix-turn-helix domain-containing protein [Kordiimonas sp. A6E486]|nr:helix-turn-helix domain-containing protein [Kordiimonas marina]